MTKFHTLEEALKEFDEKFEGFIFQDNQEHYRSSDIIKSFFPLVWQSAQEATKRELVEKIENMSIETVGNSAKTVDQILSLINK